MKKWVRIIVVVTLGALLLGFALLTTIDETPLTKTNFYKATQHRLDSLAKVPFNFEGDTLEVGWAKVNLTPIFTTSLAGYGISEFNEIKDSIWVRAFVFDNGLNTIALLVPDLLIFPPSVKKILQTTLDKLDMDGIQYSATHTHHSLGNWHLGLIGRLFAGPYEQGVVDWISSKSEEAILEAKSNLRKTKIAYAAVSAEELVYNRLVDTVGTVDPWLRFIKFEQEKGQSAILTSFSAHATTISRDLHGLHRDYPGILVDRLESTEDVDFAAFMAGAVGSQGPGGKGIGIDKADFIAQSAAGQIELIATILQPQFTKKLGFTSIKIDLREPHVRINDRLRIRPWLFDRFFGDYAASVSALSIGNNVMIGTPCDYSGELVAPLDAIAQAQGMNLMVNSFNGDYIGYITRDDWYALDKYETRTMNWFGQENGAYFNDVLEKVIEILGSQ